MTKQINNRMRRTKQLNISNFRGSIAWSYKRVSSKEQFLKSGV